MDLTIVLKYIIAAASVALVIVVLLQNKSGGLGVTFGGSSSGGEAYRSKRGIEAVLYNLTVGLIVAITLAALAIALLSN